MKLEQGFDKIATQLDKIWQEKQNEICLMLEQNFKPKEESNDNKPEPKILYHLKQQKQKKVSKKTKVRRLWVTDRNKDNRISVSLSQRRVEQRRSERLKDRNRSASNQHPVSSVNNQLNSERLKDRNQKLFIVRDHLR